MSWAVEFTESHLQKSYDRYLFLWKRLRPESEVEALKEEAVVGAEDDVAEVLTPS